jgi:hypothetical protein
MKQGWSMAEEAQEQSVSVSIVVMNDDGLLEIKPKQDADLYPETLAGADYAKCVAVPGLHDPSLPKVHGLWDLRPWVGKSRALIIHTEDERALALGSSQHVGLTSSDSLESLTITKRLRVLTDRPLGLLTVKDLDKLLASEGLA